jgi:hypothetical protein
MGRTYDTIDDTLAAWIGKQHLFFVATAPNDPDGHVNVSPKGSGQTFRILGPTTVAYLDLTGSGIETVAHLRENGRVVIMFCAFEGAPKVIRLHGRGRCVQPLDDDFAGLLATFQPNADLLLTLRSIVVVEVSRIADSCGYVVPKMTFVEERDQLFRWAENRQKTYGDAWSIKYQQANNLASIDGLPALDLPADLTEEEAARYASAGRAL